MRKSKSAPTNGVSNFSPPPRILPPKNSEMYQIQQRLSKASLYLNLLEYEFVQSSDQQLANEINNEIKTFITVNVKKLLGMIVENPNNGFSSQEETALRLIAKKVLTQEVKAPTPTLPPPPMEVEDDLEDEEQDDQEPEDDDDEYEPVPQKNTRPQPRSAPTSNKNKIPKSHLIKTKVLVTKEDGTVSEEESISQRIVKPSPAQANLRKPAPSYEQQMAAAAAAVAPLNRHLHTFNQMPLVGGSDSTDNE